LFRFVWIRFEMDLFRMDSFRLVVRERAPERTSRPKFLERFSVRCALLHNILTE